MREVSIYNIATGKIRMRLTTDQDHIDQNVQEGEAYIEGHHCDRTYHVQDSVPVEKPPVPPTPFETNLPIYQQLMEIDARSIRAIRENHLERLADLEAQAAALRAQLVPV